HRSVLWRAPYRHDRSQHGGCSGSWAFPFMHSMAADLAFVCRSRPAFLQGARFPLFARPASPAARAFAAGASDYVLQVILAVIIRNFLFGLDVAQRPDEDATPIGI